MFFRYTPATETQPSESPTMMLLHGHGSTNPSRFRDPKWNAIAPVDNFGVEGLGSWWIGESGDISTIKLLDEVIRKVCEMMNCNEINKLFIYGSSMGGFGALLHGHRYKATAVYANVPQIQLLGTTYSDGGMKQFFSGVIAEGNNNYNDLA
jgi:pimeloyl-ACP methyl ester carboxylesterase